MNTYDWLTVLDLEDPVESKLVEVSFKNGASLFTGSANTHGPQQETSWSWTQDMVVTT